jgi:GGDEF domain-containing protein
VADAPIDELLVHSEELAKGWLLAVLEQAPLEEASAMFSPDLAYDGPRVCEAILRAIADDADMRRLQPGGALELLVSRTGELTGATDPEATTRAIDALGAVIWSALRSALRSPDADQVSELAERLALLIELVRGAALRRSAGGSLGQGEPRATEGHAPASRADSGAGEGESLHREPRSPTPLRPVDSPSAGSEGARDAQPGQGQPEVESLWMGALEDEIIRSERKEQPLSLLLVELEESGRVLAVESRSFARATFGRFAQAIRGVLRRQDVLACESESRAWIIAPETGRLGAQALGARIVAAVRAAPPWRGAPLSVSVGLAVLGEDGRDREQLIEAAEESRFAAEASGLGIAGRDPDEPGAGLST